MPRRQFLHNSQEIRDALADSQGTGSDDEIEAVPVDTSQPSTSSASLIANVRARKSTQLTISASGTVERSNLNSSSGGHIQSKKHAGRKLSSDVWQYFVYNLTSNKSKCLIGDCKEELTGKYTSNLKKHLQYTHKEEYQSVIESDTVKTLTPKQIEVAAGQLLLNTRGQLLSKYDSSHPKQVKFNKQIAITFGSNPIPTSFIANEDFRKCMEIADARLTIISRPYLEKNIDILMTEIQAKITDKLNSSRRICISSDIWTKKGMTFIGVLATFYDPGEARKMNLVLGVKKFTSTHHTAANVQIEMRNVLRLYGSIQEKIWKHVTDSGSNMVCAFRNALQDSASDTDGESPNDDADGEVEDGICDNIEILNQDFPANMQYSRLSCFIHSLLLCLKKFDARKVFQNLLSKLKDLVAKFTSSQVPTGELLKLCGLKLVKFCNTRWNVVYLVVERLLRVRGSVSDVLKTCGKMKYDLTSSEWNLMIQVKDFLAPFNKYTDMSSTESSRSLSEIVMMLTQLKEHLRKFMDVRNFGIVSKEILKELDDRFGHFFSTTSTKPFEGVYLSSCLLDPRYRIALTAGEVDLATQYLLTSNWYPSSFLQEPALSENDSAGSKRRKFEFLETFKQATRMNTGLEQELQLYLQNKCFDTEDDKHDPWDFWNQQKGSFTRLSPIALDILSVPLSISTVECVFSFAGLATQGRRNRLDGDHLEREVFLNKNKHLIAFD